MKKKSSKKDCPSYLSIIFLVAVFAFVLVASFSLRELKNEVNDLDAESQAIAYAQLSSDVTQRPKSLQPAKMQMRLSDTIRGIEFNPAVSTTDVKILHDGVYFLMAAPQVGRLNPDPDEDHPACSNFFFAVNSQPVPNSNVSLCHRDPLAKDVIITQNVVPLRAGDEVSVMIATTDPEIGIGVESIAREDQPVVPSLIFSMFRIGKIR